MGNRKEKYTEREINPNILRRPILKGFRYQSSFHKSPLFECLTHKLSTNQTLDRIQNKLRSYKSLES